jgi:hypothetical protein
MQSSTGGNAMLGYRDHYVVDGGKARIILSALVTPASITDNTPLLDLVDWVRSRWKIQPKLAVGDTKYGTVPNIVGLEERGIKAYLPTSDFSQRTKYYPAKLFHYDAEKDQYICPQRQILPLVSRRTSEQVLLYKPKAEICNACSAKSKCTGSKSGRHIFRSFFQEYLDKVETYRQTEAYLKAIRKRSLWVEPLFGEAKEFNGLRRFRLRRLRKVNIEGVMVAAGQNLKRLIKHNLGMLFSLLKFISSCLISPLFRTFSTGCRMMRQEDFVAFCPLNQIMFFIVMCYKSNLFIASDCYFVLFHINSLVDSTLYKQCTQSNNQDGIIREFALYSICASATQRKWKP